MGSVGTAAWDPIFWSHHSNIDRLWYLWQLRHGESNIPPNLLPMVLQPFGLTVRDVLSINALGYEYAVSLVRI
jgi:tyrosinase